MRSSGGLPPLPTPQCCAAPGEMGVARPGQATPDVPVCGRVRDLQALRMVTEPLAHSSDSFVHCARADEA